MLRKIRDSKRLTIRSISELIGVSHSTYLDWEHDKSSPTLKAYIRLAAALDTCPVELMGHLTGKNSDPLSVEEKMNMSEMREMVGYYQNYSDLLKKDKIQVEMELVRLQELQKERSSSSPPPAGI